MWTRKNLPLLVVLATVLATSAGAQICYVREGGSGLKDGTTWANAFGDVQEAIDCFDGGTGEVWVAAGHYVSPPTGFYLPASIDLYGGFPDDATTQGLEDREPQINFTILSGDIIGDDALDPLSELPDPLTMVDNAPHVIDIVNFVSDDTVIDGFTISGGNADLDGGRSLDDKSGGGIRASGTRDRSTARLVLRDCEIRANRAGSSDQGGEYRFGSGATGADGGGVYVAGLDLLVERTTFSSNAAGDGSDGTDGLPGAPGQMGMDGGMGGSGGGLAVMGALVVTLNHAHFERNGAGKGGNGGRGGASLAGDGGAGGWGAPGGNGGGLYLYSVIQVLIQNSSCLDNQAGNAGDGGDGGSTVDGNATGGTGGSGGGSDAVYGMPAGCGGGALLHMCAEVVLEGLSFMKNTGGEGGTGGNGGTGVASPARAIGDGRPGDDGNGGEGGGLCLLDSDATMENTTFAQNKAAGNGGAISVVDTFMGKLQARHVTLAGNSADAQGGALCYTPYGGQREGQTEPVIVVNSVFYDNISGGGSTRAEDSHVWAPAPGVTIANSVLPEAPAQVAVFDCEDVDPMLKAPSWNGGDTLTLAPNPGSPIIDAPFLYPGESPPTDQRGFPRDDGFPDIGAFEVRSQASGITMTAVTGTTGTATWTPGIWGYSVVFMRPDDPGDPKPEPWDGRMYNGDPTFGNGGYITNTAWCCVYAGPGNTVDIMGLNAETKYSIMVCDTFTPTRSSGYLHNTEDAADNPLVFETASALAKATLISPVNCPDEGATGPDGDSPAHGHSLIPEPAFVWDPPGALEGAHFEVWLDGFKIGDTAIDPIGFRYFDGAVWHDFSPVGMHANTQRLAFLRVPAGTGDEEVLINRGPAFEQEWWVVTSTATRSVSESDHWRFLTELPIWEDGLPVAGLTLIRKAQIDQLRIEADALLRLRGLTDYPFTDATITMNQTPIRAAHFQEIRQAIEQAAAETGEDTASWLWTDPTLIPNQTVIKASHLQELRDALEGNYPIPPPLPVRR